jgi:hypothetical protein
MVDPFLRSMSVLEEGVPASCGLENVVEDTERIYSTWVREISQNFSRKKGG